ncbi:MAG: hypothetical protein IM618_15630 [Cytophagales bacterium]|nr:hypothetical protein [Cytophagales bacterium]
MKYFGINWTDDINQIGFYPQTSINSGTDIFKNQLNETEVFPQKGLIEINSKAKPTNFLDKSPISKGIIIDKKFLEILERHKLPPYRLHPIKTIYQNRQLEYYWFLFTSNTQRYIDFNQSKVKIITISTFREIGEFELTSIEFKNKIASALTFEHSLVIKSIYLKETFPQYDIIDLDKVTPGVFISERLNDELNTQGMTGFVSSEYKPIRILTM